MSTALERLHQEVARGLPGEYALADAVFELAARLNGEPPLVAKSAVRVNVYEVLARAVEAGVAAGVHRAQKHWEKQLEPEQSAQIEEEVCRAVRGELCDVLVFDEPEGS